MPLRTDRAVRRTTASRMERGPSLASALGRQPVDADERWARLFAAAPDLLEACRALLVYSPDLREGLPLWNDIEAGLVNFDQALKDAYRAIRKAEQPPSTKGTVP